MKCYLALVTAFLLVSGVSSARDEAVLLHSTGEDESKCWRGIVFGIHMQALFYGISQQSFENLIIDIERLASEYEAAFSLYSDQSELSVLNTMRGLDSPTPLFRSMCLHAKKLNDQSLGYFAPTMEYVWEVIKSGNASASKIKVAHAASPMRHLVMNVGGVALNHPRTRLSFNAIVQGAFADAVAAATSLHSIKCALLQLGETVAIGLHPDGRPWSLAIHSSDSDRAVIDVLQLTDSALAVSAQARGDSGFDPVAGAMHQRELVVAVESSAGALVADAFATAFLSAPSSDWPKLFDALIGLGKARVFMWQDGERLCQFD